MNKVLDLQQLAAFQAAVSYGGQAARAKSSSDNSFKDLMAKPADSDKAVAGKKEQPKQSETKKPDQPDKEVGRGETEDKEQDKKDKITTPGEIVLLSDLLMAHGDDSEAALKAFLEAGSQTAEEVVPAIVTDTEETITAFAATTFTTTETPVTLQETAAQILSTQAEGNSLKETVNPSDLARQQVLSEAVPAEGSKETGKSQTAEQQTVLPEQQTANSEKGPVYEQTGKTVPGVKTGLAGMELSKVSPDGSMKVEVTGIENSDEGTTANQMVTEEPEAPVKAAGSEHLEEILVKTGKSEHGDEVEQLAMQQESQPVVKQDTEVVKIKVADPYTHLSQENVQNLADQITKNLINGKETFQVQMNPEHLGKITIKIAYLAEGVKVTLSCENQKTMNLLSERAGAINQIVEQNTHAPVQVEVQEGSQEQQRNSADQNGGQNRSQEEHPDKKSEQTEADDFIQQLRLGIFGDTQ